MLQARRSEAAARSAGRIAPPKGTGGGPSWPALRVSNGALLRVHAIGERLATILGTLHHHERPIPSDAIHRCPLCGRQFTTAEAAACPTCPIAERCGLVMCPSCGYEFSPS